jgi:hypothetical protein
MLKSAIEHQLGTKSSKPTSGASLKEQRSGVIVKRMADDSSSTESLHQKRRKFATKQLLKLEDSSSAKMYQTRSRTGVVNRLVGCHCFSVNNRRTHCANGASHSNVISHCVNNGEDDTAHKLSAAADEERLNKTIGSSCSSSTAASSQADSVSLNSCTHSSESSVPEEEVQCTSTLTDMATDTSYIKENRFKNVRRNIFDSSSCSQMSCQNLSPEGYDLPDLSDGENDDVVLASAVLPVTASTKFVATTEQYTLNDNKGLHSEHDHLNKVSPTCPDLEHLDLLVVNEVCRAAHGRHCTL